MTESPPQTFSVANYQKRVIFRVASAPRPLAIADVSIPNQDLFHVFAIAKTWYRAETDFQEAGEDMSCIDKELILVRVRI